MMARRPLRIRPAWILAATLAAGAGPLAAASGDDPSRPAAGLPAATAATAAPTGTRSTYMNLIRELQAQGQSFAVLAHVAQYETRWGASPDTQLLRADALRATAQGEAAATVYRSLLKGPRAAAAHRGLGLLEAGAQRWPAAVEELSAAARLDPTDAATLSDLGYAHLQAGQLDLARVPLMTAAQLRPEDSRTLANLATWFFAAGQPEQAEAVLRSPHVSDAARAMVRGRRGTTGGSPPLPAAAGVERPPLPASAPPTGAPEWHAALPPPPATAPRLADPTPAAAALSASSGLPALPASEAAPLPRALPRAWSAEVPPAVAAPAAAELAVPAPALRLEPALRLAPSLALGARPERRLPGATP